MDRRDLPPSVLRVVGLVEDASEDLDPAVADCDGQPAQDFEIPVRLVRKTVYRELPGRGQYKAAEDYLPAEDPASWVREGVAPERAPFCGCGCGGIPRWNRAGREASWMVDDGGRT